MNNFKLRFIIRVSEVVNAEGGFMIGETGHSQFDRYNPDSQAVDGHQNTGKMEGKGVQNITPKKDGILGKIKKFVKKIFMSSGNKASKPLGGVLSRSSMSFRGSTTLYQLGGLAYSTLGLPFAGSKVDSLGDKMTSPQESKEELIQPSQASAVYSFMPQRPLPSSPYGLFRFADPKSLTLLSNHLVPRNVSKPNQSVALYASIPASSSPNIGKYLPNIQYDKAFSLGFQLTLLRRSPGHLQSSTHYSGMPPSPPHGKLPSAPLSSIGTPSLDGQNQVGTKSQYDSLHKKRKSPSPVRGTIPPPPQSLDNQAQDMDVEIQYGGLPPSPSVENKGSSFYEAVNDPLGE